MIDAVSIRPIVPAAQIGLRGDPADARFADAVMAATGLALPVAANTASRDGDKALLWLGPTEWLMVADTAAGLLTPLSAALSGLHAGVLDLGAARAVREIAGPGARDLLARGCAIDLHASRFGPGHVAQTLLARTQILLHQTDAAPAYRLFVRPSFAAYLDAWLADAQSVAETLQTPA